MRKLLASILAASLLLTATACSSDKGDPSSSDSNSSSMESTSSEEQNRYEGAWYRTNVHSGYASSMGIMDVTETEFSFYIDIQYFSITNSLSGKAQFQDENTAIYEYTSADNPQTFTFTFGPEDSLVITSTGDGSIGMQGDSTLIGAEDSSASTSSGSESNELQKNITLTGEYTRNSATYTNQYAYYETISPEQESAIEDLLDAEGNSDIFNQFEYSVSLGVVQPAQQVTDDIPGTLYVVDFPTSPDDRVKFLFGENGRYYINFARSEYGYYTDDPERTDSMPACLAF